MTTGGAFDDTRTASLQASKKARDSPHAHQLASRAGFARVLQLSRPVLPLRPDRGIAKIAAFRSIFTTSLVTMT
jgi:hypothetical protein